ncbi:MAG: hypothetical protein IJ409_11710 [Lachnospiraceae bacterium]|nr:hypothetical protein [Lachnospiraceae bacterium]
MKFVKRISLFFIYPMTMFGIGFASNMAIMEFFYPGENVPVKSNTGKEEISVQVSVTEEPVVNADTLYVVQSYNAKTGEASAEEETAPDKYMGLTRDMLSSEIESYNQNPSLHDLEKGFTFMELVSFSSERVVVRKSYEPEEEKGFFLLNEDHKVVVYDHSLKYVYMSTDIFVDELPEQIQEEILHMKYIENESELFNFLESYSS